MIHEGARTCCPRMIANLVVPEGSMLAVIRSTSCVAPTEPKYPSLVLVPKRTTKLTGAVGGAPGRSGSSDVIT